MVRTELVLSARLSPSTSVFGSSEESVFPSNLCIPPDSNRTDRVRAQHPHLHGNAYIPALIPPVVSTYM